MYPHVPSNLFARRVREVLDVVLLSDLFFGLRVGECRLEHAGGADKAIVGATLEEGANALVVVASRKMREPVTPGGREATHHQEVRFREFAVGASGKDAAGPKILG